MEKWIPQARRRKDLFGFIDVLCLGDLETVGVQTTSKSNLSNRIKKMSEHENIGIVRDANWTLLAHGWYKEGRFWRLKEVDVS